MKQRLPFVYNRRATGCILIFVPVGRSFLGYLVVNSPDFVSLIPPESGVSCAQNGDSQFRRRPMEYCQAMVLKSRIWLGGAISVAGLAQSAKCVLWCTVLWRVSMVLHRFLGLAYCNYSTSLHQPTQREKACAVHRESACKVHANTRA